MNTDDLEHDFAADDDENSGSRDVSEREVGDEEGVAYTDEDLDRFANPAIR